MHMAVKPAIISIIFLLNFILIFFVALREIIWALLLSHCHEFLKRSAEIASGKVWFMGMILDLFRNSSTRIIEIITFFNGAFRNRWAQLS